ncbi:Thioredoxin superfamily protein [Prunus dulcis]|uniref:Thioredoxin superfamily protein n=1 Tax=Prunus dulcis TaxID=3755 RepID=A0A4Y1RPA5_PRUDU|nr:Thioredoxin superfamily protein [Prunus dulcis]
MALQETDQILTAAKPRTESSLNGEDAASLLETVKVFDLNGNGIPISDLWKDRTAVIAFARHFGCVFCRKRADYLASKKDIMDASGVALVLIGPGSIDQGKAFAEQTKFKGEVYADPSHSSYEALRFVSGVLTTFTPKVRLKIIELYMEGYRQDWKLSFEQDTVARGGWQQGGILVAGPGKSNILYIHKANLLSDKEAGDDPDIKDILKACCGDGSEGTFLDALFNMNGEGLVRFEKGRYRNTIGERKMADFLTFGAQEILKKVASLASREISLLWGFQGEVKTLRDLLSFTEAILQDAEKSQGQAMEMWVKKLEDLAHDADDVLDDYKYELLRRKVEIQNQMKKKVLNFLSLHNPVAFRLKIAHKIKNINASLESLNTKAASVGLVARPDATSRQVGVVLDRETISGFDQDEKYMVGREELVSDIVTDLINSSTKRETRPCVMAIVGMAGLGKTTLAKAVYHENEISSHFNTKIWVCVSTPFDVKKILSGMLEYVEPTKAGIKGKAAICENLQEILKGKRYLLILDDILKEATSLSITTRSAHVASIIQTLPNKAVSDRSGPLSEDQERIGRDVSKLKTKESNGIRHVAQISTIEVQGVPKGIVHKVRSMFVGEVFGNILPKFKGLRVLKLKGDFIDELPNSMGKLKHLRTYGGTICPVGMGRLNNLRSLSFFIVGKETGRGIKELGGLKHLKGELCIYDLKHVRDGEEAKEAKLAEKTNIRRLKLTWSANEDWSRVINNDSDVLEGLKPHSALEILEIRNFSGDTFP